MREHNDKTNLRDELVASLTEGMAIPRDEVKPTRFHPALAAVDVRAVRERLGLTQESFARRSGFGLAIVRNWEPCRYQLDQTTRTYLLVIGREPAAVERVLQSATA